jgi:hypothetical protein
MSSKLFHKTVLVLWVLLTGLIVFKIIQLNNEDRVLEEKKNNQIIKQKIDTLETKRTSILDFISNESETNAARVKKITKSLKDEKITIPDTTYAAMCEYITNYRSE